MDEMLELMRKAWTGEPFSYKGEFYDLPPLQMSPAVSCDLPILIGGTSRSALERAAQHQGFTGAQHEMAEVESIVAGLREAREARGTSLEEDFEIALSLYDPSERNVERCQELGVTLLYRDAFCDENGMASKMSLDDKLRDMEAFAARHFI